MRAASPTATGMLLVDAVLCEQKLLRPGDILPGAPDALLRWHRSLKIGDMRKEEPPGSTKGEVGNSIGQKEDPTLGTQRWLVCWVHPFNPGATLLMFLSDDRVS